jgi:hypothetical protein
MAFQHGVPAWRSSMAFQHGVPAWRNGVPSQSLYR